MKTIRIFHLMLLALLSPALAVNPPGILNHQGRIAVNGANYDGPGHFKFALVNGGTNTLWSNDATSTGGGEPIAAVEVPIAKGHYAVLLGDTAVPNMTTTIPASVFTDHETVALRLWFATASDGPFELLSPDRRIAASGYALAAQQAAAVAPGGVTSIMLADGAVTTAKLANGAVTGTALAPGAVTSAAIADGSVTSSDLALGASGLVKKPVLLVEVGGGEPLVSPLGLEMPWTIEIVASVGDVGKFSSLAFSPAGHPAIGFYDATSKDLKFAKRTGAVWETSTVDADDDVGMFASLAFSPAGQPSISCYKNKDFPGGGLRYAQYTGSSWHIATIAPGWRGENSSLAFGPSGDPAVSYYNHGGFNLWYTSYNGQTGSWPTYGNVVDPGPPLSAGIWSSLAFDPLSIHPTISYGVQESGELKFASYTGSNWDLSTVSVGSGTGFTSLDYDPAGRPTISFFGNDSLKCAVRDGGAWSVQVVDGGGVGWYTSLEFGADGMPVISYYDQGNGDLKLAVFNGSTWDIEVVDSVGNVGMYSSLAFGASGELGIAYYDSTNGNLKYAERGGFSWRGNSAGVFVLDGKAYHTNANSGDGTLSILEVSNPAQPAILVELASPHPTFALGGARDAFVSGSTAYVTAADDNALNIMDVSDPADPQLLALLRDGESGFDRLAGAWSVFVSGNTAYVSATGDDALTIIDVSNPSAPVKLAELGDEVGGFTKLAGARDVFVDGDTAYVTAADDHALTIIDVSNPAAPVLLAEIVDETGGFTKLAGAREVFVLDGVAYVTADEDDALNLIDVGNPSSPALLSEVVDGVGGFNRLDGAAGVHVSGSIAMVTAEGDAAVSMIDVSNPAAPVLLEETVDESGGFTKLAGADGIFIAGTIALVASNQDDALTLMDLASPAAEYAGTVTNAALATDSVTSDKILDGSVGNADVGDNAIDSSKIADASIESDDLADDTIDSNKIVDSSIGNEDLADGVVDSGKIADGSITTDDLADNAVTTTALADDSVTTSKILDETILSEDLADGAVTVDKIADGAVGGSKLSAGGVATEALASAAVTGEKLASASVTLDKLALGGSAGQILFNTGTATEWRNPVAVLGDESATNEIQELSIDGGVLALSKGGNSVSIADADADPMNELQALSLDGDSLSLLPSGGSPVDLSQYFRSDGSQAFGGALDLNSNEIRSVRKLGIGIGTSQAALHVFTSDTEGPPVPLLEHSISSINDQITSVARLRAVNTNTLVDGFGAGLAFENKGSTAGPYTIARIGAARDGADEMGALVFQTQALPDGLTTRMTVRAGGDVEMQRDLYIGNADGSSDDTIYFDRNGDESLQWQNSQGRFMFSDDVWATTFNPTSDRNLKEKFEDVDPMEVLDQVAAMPVTTWNFKDDAPTLRHIGPMAQDFHQAFGLGLDDRHISTTDADGVAFAAIQGLKRLLDDKERKIHDLEARLQKLEQSSQTNR
jgi:hypothetical protein